MNEMIMMQMFRAFICVITVLLLGYVLLTKNNRGPIFARFWTFIALGMLLFTLAALSESFGHNIYQEAIYAISLLVILYAYFETLKDSLSSEMKIEQELNVSFKTESKKESSPATKE